MRKHLSTCIIVLIFLIGLSLLLYPTLSDYVNSRNQTRAITEYDDKVSKLEKEQYEEILQKARAYNENLAMGQTGNYRTKSWRNTIRSWMLTIMA